MKNIETTAMRRNRKRPYKINRIPKGAVPKYKQTNNMMCRRYWTNATITLKTDIILNRAFANKLNKYKPGKSKRMPLSMFIRYNKKILYFTKYFHITNGWRI